jgi:uncharacterized glyoxalase superfamily protein PhnB
MITGRSIATDINRSLAAEKRLMTTVPSACTVRELWPLLTVQDLGRSIAFYRDQLGFELVGDAQSAGRVFWCRLQRGAASLMLQQAEEEDGPPAGRGRGVSLYFVCDEVDGLYEEFTHRGVKLEPPSVAYYGMKQLLVSEPDGYSICFESAAQAP